MQDYEQRIDQMMAKFECMKNLDSKVFVEIPQKLIIEASEYRTWLAKHVEMKWMKEFNQNDDHYPLYLDFNVESGIGGNFGGVYFDHCKLYRYDGTENGLSEEDYRAKRGFLIRDHYSKLDVVKVQLITDNLIEFLQQEGIEHARRNFRREV